MDENFQDYEKKLWKTAAHMARLFDGSTVEPAFDWLAVRNGIAEMFEKMAKDVK